MRSVGHDGQEKKEKLGGEERTSHFQEIVRELAIPEWRLSTIALDGRIIDP